MRNLCDIFEDMNELLKEKEAAERTASRLLGCPVGDVRAVALDGMPRGGNRVESCQQQMRNIQTALDAIEDATCDLRRLSRKVETFINTLPSLDERSVMQARYLQFLPVSECAKMCGYLRQSAYAVIQRVLERLQNQ